MQKEGKTVIPRKMITFKENSTRFTYRIGGIAIHNNHVLAQKADLADPTYWFLLGGRAELYEASVKTLEREVEEELGVEATVGRLVYVLENFFGLPERPHHELGLYFLLSFPPDAYLYHQPGPYEREEDGALMIFDWLPLADLEHSPLYPSVFGKLLQHIPEQTEHVLWTEPAKSS